MTNPEFVALRGMWPLKGSAIQRRNALYQIQGYYHYAEHAGDFFDEATHYLVAGPFNEDKMEIARPNAKLLACVRLDKRSPNQDFVDDYFILRYRGKDTTWNYVTSGIHRRTEVASHNTRHNDYPHLKEGEEVFFVFKQPIPTDVGHKLIPWRGLLGTHYV